MKKVDKIEVLQDKKVKVWYSNHTMDGKVTVNYSEGQDLIIKGDKDKAAEYDLTKLTEELWSSKKVVNKKKK
jgi:hypothetical protein